MSAPDTKFLRRFQDHLAAKLLSEPLLNSVCIVEQRKQILLDVSARVNPVMGGRNSKVGVGILINLPSADPSPDADVPGAQMDALIWLDILSKDDINLVVSNGANLPAEEVLTAVWLLLNQWLNQGLGSGNLFVDGFDPIEDKRGAYGYRLQLRLRSAADQPAKVDAPTCVIAAGHATLTTQLAGSTIYYTLDGSFPGPGNNTASQYAAPVVVTSGQQLLTAAYKANYIGSDVWMTNVP